MKVLAYCSETESFFIGASFNEFNSLKDNYEIRNVGSSVELAYQCMEEERKIIKMGKKSIYFDEVMLMYGITDVPDICFSVDRNLSVIEIMEHTFPFGHMRNGYSLWTTINVAEIQNLSELITLKCEKGEEGCII